MSKQVRYAIIAIVIVVPTLSLGLWYSESQIVLENPNNSQIVLLASFYPIYEFTKQVGGDKVSVSLLVPQNVEPHDWEPTIRDIQKIEHADAVIINGVGFENWVDNVLEINPRIQIIDTSKNIAIIQSRTDVTSSDPHIWLNPVTAMTQVQNIADALIEIDPSNESYYDQNSKKFQSELSTLDKKIIHVLSDCKTDFLAFHNAFSYFANQYGLTQHTVVNTSGPHAESTPQSLENIIRLSKELGISVIFSEEGIDQRTTQVLANELGIQVLTLSPIEIVDNNSYITRMEQNISNLKVALCQS